MKLQVCLDQTDENKTIEILNKVADLVDIIEIGTPFICYNGVRSVFLIKNLFPDKTILVDLKLADNARDISEPFLKAGANIITVLGNADDTTICQAVLTAKEYGGSVLVDFINVKDTVARFHEIENLNLDIGYIAFHWGIDHKRKGFDKLLEDVSLIKKISSIPIAAIGGITTYNIALVASINPALIGIGKGIMCVEDPRESTLRIRHEIELAAQKHSNFSERIA